MKKLFMKFNNCYISENVWKIQFLTDLSYKTGEKTCYTMWEQWELWSVLSDVQADLSHLHYYEQSGPSCSKYD